MAKHREKWEDKLQNYFKDIVYELDEDMSDIKRLDLSNKNLNYLPKELVNLTKLEALNLKDNNFTEIPNVIYDMNRLVNLNFSNNSITKISNELIQYYIGVCDGSRFPEFEFDFESCKLILDGNDNLLFTEEQLYNHFSYSNKNPPNYKFIFSPVILKRSILNIFKDDETFQFYMTPKKGENEFYYMTTQGTGNHEIDKLVDYLYTIDFSKDDYSFKEFCWNFFSKTKSEFFNLETLEVTDINTFEFISKHINEFNNLNRLTLNFSSNSASLKNISLFKSIKELEIHVDLIHNEIGKLEKLETLEISTFKQTHAFEMSDSDFFDMPTSFENLLNLNSLIFVGKIPRSLDIKHLNLSILVISSCPSSNFPKWIKDVKISTVQLHNCQLFEFTDESVDRVKEVSKILLTNCLIPSIPSSIEKLTNLSEFKLKEYDSPLLFRTLPDTIVKLNNLTYLSIGSFSWKYIDRNLFLSLSQQQHDWLQNLKNDGCKIEIHEEEMNLLACFKSQEHNFRSHDEEPWIYNYTLQGSEEEEYYIPDTIEELYRIKSLSINIENYPSAFIPQVYSLPNLKKLSLYIQKDTRVFFIYKKLKTLQEHDNIDVIEIISEGYELPKQINSLLNRQAFINNKVEKDAYNTTFIFSK